MMKLKDCSLIIAFLCFCWNLNAQYTITGVVSNEEKQLAGVEVFVVNTGKIVTTNRKGLYEIQGVAPGEYELIAFSEGYQTSEKLVLVEDKDVTLDFFMERLAYSLTEVVVQEQQERVFALKRLKAVEGTAIYAGKKSEVVLLDQLTANTAANNARQVYSQVTGINIFESNDAGLQLNIGGRGLDPTRTASFNTRQNGYDISADVLGYPESYYTPPAEALSEIQVVRGAASLQYGTQFGGLVNFKFRKPNPNKKIELRSRQTLGSFDLFTSFNSLSGTLGKFSYYTFFNYKKGDSFRPNSGFTSRNAFAHLGYQFNEKTKINFELTSLYYLAQQPGGITDAQFYEDPTFSNRERNWFQVDWLLYALKLEHRFSPQTELSVQLFGLDAKRNALGFRTNRVSQVDDANEPRDLILGEFNNWGAETRLLHRYKIGKRDAVALIGAKYYKADNTAIQGPGSAEAGANFELATNEFPAYPNQSDFEFPNTNLALFGEHIFYLSDKFSVTPGVRFEYIQTSSEGTFKKIDFDLAGNPIRNAEFEDNRIFDRSFVLLGIGLSYKPDLNTELFGNFSQNYRSVTFSDIRIVNPSFQVDPNISDEDGFTFDFGLRGRLKEVLSYDLGGFALLYDNRLGEVLRAETRPNADGEIVETGRVVRFRGNIGQAFIYGMESLLDWNVARTFFPAAQSIKLNAFVNTSLTQSEYLDSEIPGVEGNEVEFIPTVNLKTGLNFGYKNLLGSIQYTYLSRQFTDASNAPQDRRDNQSGIRGAIPAYSVMDISLSYRFKFLKLETGINNTLDEQYFTRRATGYPGPGIIPSAPRSYYVTLEVKI